MRAPFAPAIYAVLALAWSNSASATDDLPSLCESNEEIVLTSAVRKVLKGESVGEEKIVSICGKTRNNQIDRLVYRFGSKNEVEIEIRATNRQRAKIFKESDAGAPFGRVGIRFEKRPYSYEISQGLGMSSVVNVEVYHNKTLLALFQGCTSYGCPFSSELLEISLSMRKVASGILQTSKPIEPW